VLLYGGIEECGGGAVGGPVDMGSRRRAGTVNVALTALVVVKISV
jgi:hypothetical protein